jgi:hypothetical protein
MKQRVVLLLAPLVFLLYGCPLNMEQSPQGSGGQQPPTPAGSSASTAGLSVATDTARNQGVLVTSSGSRIDITSVADDGTIVNCTDAVGAAVMDNVPGNSKSLSASNSAAIIVGTRSDGYPGAWVYSSNRVQSVIDDDSGRATSRLPDSDAQNGVFRGHFGWLYHVMGVSEDGKIIVGYAENKKGLDFGKITIDPGTTIGVYWKVSRHPFRPAFVVSHAQIIGTLDQSKLSIPPRYRNFISALLEHALSQLKLFLINYLNSYLVMVDKNGVHFDSTNDVYVVTGTDQADVAATATIDQKGGITITESSQGQGQTPNIYAAGSYSNGSATVACSWVNGVRTDLPGDGNASHSSNAYSIFVSGGTIYVAGSYFNGTTTIACYWVNGTKIDLPGDGTGQNPATAYSIYVLGGTVYTAGYYGTTSSIIACTWSGNVKTDLDGGNGAIASSVFVSGGTIYTAGQYNLFGTATTACIWTGTAKTDLPGANGAAAQGVFASGSTIYAAGEYSLNNSPSVAALWVGTTKTDLPGNAGTAASIYVSGGTTYAAGQYKPGSTFNACYWAGTTRTDLPGTSGNAQSIFVSAGIVYTAGFYSNGGATVACYWTGTTRTDLPGARGMAASIFVQ